MSDHRELDPKHEPSIDAQPRCKRSHLKDHRKHWIGSERIEAPPGAIGAIRCMFGDEIAFYPVPGSGDSDDGLLSLFFAPWPVDPDADRPAGWCGLLGPDGNPTQRVRVRQETGLLFGGAQPRPRAVVDATQQPTPARAGTAQPLHCDACGARPTDGVPVREGSAHYRRLVHAAGVPGRESGTKLRSCGTWVRR